jgi:hypothetical protein
VHRGSRPRGLRGARGRAGLASTIGPVLVGVIFAFAWNMAGSHAPGMPQPGPGLAPTVGTAVDQAADQAWASVMPSATRLPDRRVPSPAAPTTRPLAHRRSGHSGTMIAVVPAGGKPTLRFAGHVDGYRHWEADRLRGLGCALALHDGCGG